MPVEMNILRILRKILREIFYNVALSYLEVVLRGIIFIILQNFHLKMIENMKF